MVVESKSSDFVKARPLNKRVLLIIDGLGDLPVPVFSAPTLVKGWQ